MSYIFGKLWHLAIIWAIRKAFQCILQGVRFSLANHTRLSPTSENDSYQQMLDIVFCWVVSPGFFGCKCASPRGSLGIMYHAGRLYLVHRIFHCITYNYLLTSLSLQSLSYMTLYYISLSRIMYHTNQLHGHQCLSQKLYRALHHCNFQSKWNTKKWIYNAKGKVTQDDRYTINFNCVTEVEK